MEYRLININKGCCSLSKSGCNGCNKKQLNTFDWLGDIPESVKSTQLVEVQFKNTRKSYFINSDNVEIHKGDIVTVEAHPGHDVGVVSLTGKLVERAIKKNRFNPQNGIIPKIFRIANETDIAKWEEAKSREHDTMIRSRKIASSLFLDMKIGDVEYQADGLKAIFYYIADNRVDFRQLIKVLAETFHIRVEMKQIGARQEAGRIGGIGPCGKELCCSKWKNNFMSVNTSAARIQDLSINPQKLTGMCGKLKCCLNHEVDTYLEITKKMPSTEISLETKDNTYYHFKTEYFKNIMTYSKNPETPVDLVSIDFRRVFEIINMNKRGEKPESLEYNNIVEKPKDKPKDILAENSLTRFDEGDKKNNKKGSSQNKNRRRQFSPNRKKMAVKDEN